MNIPFLRHNPYLDFDPSPFPLKIEGWNSQHPIFRRLIEQTQPKLIIEVGTWLGASAIHMAQIVQELNLDTTIVCVDTWLGAESDYTFGIDVASGAMNYKNGFPQLYQQFLSNVIQSGVQEIIMPFPQTSFIASQVFDYYNLHSADLIYIDGSHDVDSVYDDIWNWHSKLRSGGYMFGDDYDHNDVREAVGSFVLAKDNLQIDGVKWQIQKP